MVNRPPLAFRRGQSVPQGILRPLALAIGRRDPATITILALRAPASIRRVLWEIAAETAQSPAVGARSTDDSTRIIESDLKAVFPPTLRLIH